MLKFLGRDGWNERVRIISRPRGYRQNVAVGWIDNHDGAAFGFRFERFFSELLQSQIQRRDDVVSGHRRFDQLLGSFAAVLVKRDFVFAVLASEHFVERLLEPVASFRFRPKRFMVVDDAVEIAACLSGVTDNLAGHFSIRINAHVDRAHNHAGRRIIFYLSVLQLAKILRDLHRHDSPVVVMAKNRIVGNLKFATN